MANFFKPTGAAGQDAQDFVNDAFDDFSLAATNNTGFSTSVAKNPVSVNIANSDAPTFSYKTLWIKDLLLLSDRSQWLDNKPTYKVIFHEEYPNVYAFVVGNCRLRNLPNGLSVDIKSEGDYFALTTYGRRVHFFTNPVPTASTTATVKVDGATNGTSVSIGDNANGSSGINYYSAGVHASSNETRDLHTYQLVTSTASVLNVAGIGVYFENSTQTVDFLPGSTYIDKTKYTTTSGSGVSLPTFTNYNGGKVLAYKTTLNAYALSANQRTAPTSTALGASGANTITVATGSGASFPIGSGIGLRDNGGSFALHFVTSVSTDTLTVSPTLAMGVSGTVFKAFNVGTTQAISATMHQLQSVIDLGSAFQPINQYAFLNSTSTNLYSDPYNRWRVFGQSLTMSAIDGYRGVIPSGVNSFIQVDGNFQAAEIEYIPFPGITSVIHATLGVNGIVTSSQNQGVTGTIKQTIFTDGMPGWNTFKLGFGGSMMNTVISQINLYNLAPPASITLGRLGEMDVYGSQINRSAVNASLMTVGTFRRVYADQFYLTGAWTFGASAAMPGAVWAQGSSTNSVLQMNYFGKDFALIGSQSASLTVLLDGQSVSATLNQLYSVATLGFHSVAVSNRASLVILNAFDFTRPYGEMKNLQTFEAQCDLDSIPAVYAQSDTPQNPKDGDLWGANPKDGTVWVRMWNRWVQLQTLAQTDDPNAGVGIVSHGSSGSDYTAGNALVSIYNSTSWLSGVADSVSGTGSSAADSAFANMHIVVDYNTTAEARTTSSRQFNRASWATFTSRTTGRTWNQNTTFRGKNQYYASKGVSTGGTIATAGANADSWNGTAWVAATNWPNPLGQGGTAEISGVLYSVGGFNTSNVIQDLLETRTTADSVNTATAAGTATQPRATMNDTVLRAAFICMYASGSSANTAAFRYNGSSWNTSITAPTSQGGAAPQGFCAASQSRALSIGGASSNAVYSYNGSAFAAQTNLDRNAYQGAASFL
jgi:hypothetical protein